MEVYDAWLLVVHTTHAMSQTSDRPPIPRSIRHKQILDLAEEKPDASLTEIADEIPSATADLIERVFEQYGDPAADQNEPPSENGELEADDVEASTNAITSDSPDLTEEQRELLDLIVEHPEATQRELADLLDVSAPTVSNRASTIPEFDWENRKEFIGTISEEEANPTLEKPTQMVTTNSDQQSAGADLADRIATVEQQVETLTTAPKSRSVFEQPELTHKVVHACMESDAISEEEELEILKLLIR